MKVRTAEEIAEQQARRAQLAQDTHIPSLRFRWYVGSDDSRLLQQRCTTPGGTPFWKDVPEFSFMQGESFDDS